MEPTQREMWRLAARFGTVGLEMGAAIAVGYFIGWTLDRWLDTAPWLMLTWLVIGIAAAFKRLVTIAKHTDLTKL